MILDKIVATKKEEVEQAKEKTPLSVLKAMAGERGPCRDFKAAVSGKDYSIIAEVKCASPSRGRLVRNFDPVGIARMYEENGAAAISVLTDEKYFMGKKEYLTEIGKQVRLPLLRKDFVIDPYQLYESQAIGADAVLLIVRILGERLGQFITLANMLGLTALTEVHTGSELEIALAAGADIIGINNRNLDTFVTDIGTCKELAHSIPAGKIIVAESGIATGDDIKNIAQAGIHTFLVGESLVTSENIGRKLRELRGEAGNGTD